MGKVMRSESDRSFRRSPGWLEPGLNQLFLEGLPTPQGIQQVFVTRRRVLIPKCFAGAGEPTTLKIGYGPCTLGMLTKLELEPPIGPLKHGKERFADRFYPRFPGDLDPSHRREGLHGLHEFKAVVLKKEGKGRPVHATAEAVVEPFSGTT